MFAFIKRCLRNAILCASIVWIISNLSACSLNRFRDEPSTKPYEGIESKISCLEQSLNSLKLEIHNLSVEVHKILSHSNKRKFSLFDYFDLCAFFVFIITCVCVFFLVMAYIDPPEKFTKGLICLFMLLILSFIFSFISKFPHILYFLGGVSATFFILQLIFPHSATDISKISNYIFKLVQFDVTPKDVTERIKQRLLKSNFKV